MDNAGMWTAVGSGQGTASGPAAHSITIGGDLNSLSAGKGHMGRATAEVQ